MTVSAYKVKVPNFEGPLDLLLFFIRRDELNIYDIPIAYITKEFLEYMRLMQLLDLELAGEFIVMAAMLMQIKVRMMLPKPAVEGEEGEAEDPRAELVRRLIEYKRFKEVAGNLKQMEEEQRHLFFRTYFQADERKREIGGEELLEDVSLFDLIKAFRRAISVFENRPVHEVNQIPYSIEDQANFLMERFRDRSEYDFHEIIAELTEKIQVVVTFIALLELIRARRVRIKIQSEFNDFVIIKNEVEETAA